MLTAAQIRKLKRVLATGEKFLAAVDSCGELLGDWKGGVGRELFRTDVVEFLAWWDRRLSIAGAR